MATVAIIQPGMAKRDGAGMHSMLRELRLARGLTLTDVAARSRELHPPLAAISNPYLSQIETGRLRGLSFSRLLTLATIYEVPVESLIEAAPAARRASLLAKLGAYRARLHTVAVEPHVADLLLQYSRLRGGSPGLPLGPAVFLFLSLPDISRTFIQAAYHKWACENDWRLYDMAGGLRLRLSDADLDALLRHVHDSARLASLGKPVPHATAAALMSELAQVVATPTPVSPAELEELDKLKKPRRRRGPRPGGSKPAPPPE